MSTDFAVKYYDRRSRCIQTEGVFAAGFLRWSYNSAMGRFCTRAILSRRMVSRLLGVVAQSRVSRYLIAPFVRHGRVDPGSIEKSLAAYGNFNEFFTRELATGQRSVVSSRTACVSPVDGRVLVLEGLDGERTFRVKRSLFNLRRLLAHDELTRRYWGGTAVICRLTLADYHRVHFPVDGVPDRARAIDGRLYAGGPYAKRWLVPFYTDNYRAVTPIQSEHFGLVTQVEIGAFTVGSIRQQYRAGVRVSRGGMKARFEIGGSTVVLLFEPGSVKIDADILRWSRQGLETRVRCGDALGQTAIARSAPCRSGLECAA